MTTYSYSATVRRVVDGDTVDLDVDLGFRVALAIRTRLLGINAPELRDQAGRDVRDALQARLPGGEQVTVTTFRDPRDKYGRWLATIEHRGEILNDWLVREGMADTMEGSR
jgi:micrococcal nuclease